MTHSIIFFIAGLLLAPLMPGIAQKVKAQMAGRRGAPLLQPYFDLAKLLRKGMVCSQTTTFVFRLGPIVGLASVLTAGLLIPVGIHASPVSFAGDVILLVYLLGVSRFVTVLAGLDTGSSFEGMGGSREVWISVLAEPALFLSFAALARQTGAWSLSGIMAALSGNAWSTSPAIVLLVCVALAIVFLAENARIPVDDPNTHLELTMIHEVMVLDHCGVDLAFILYGRALKLWVTGTVLINVLLPVHAGVPGMDIVIRIAGMGTLAAGVGLVESSMARLRLRHVPQFLVGAVSLAAIALILAMEGGA